MKAQIIVTGNKFLGSKFRAIGPVIEEIIASAQKEIIIVSYVMTGSINDLLAHLENALKRNIKIKMILNNLDEKDIRLNEWIQNAKSNYTNFSYKIVSDENIKLHAKVIIVDRIRAVIGSANLTWSGMTTNYEVGMYMEGPEIWDLSTLIDLTFT